VFDGQQCREHCSETPASAAALAYGELLLNASRPRANAPMARVKGPGGEKAGQEARSPQPAGNGTFSTGKERLEKQDTNRQRSYRSGYQSHRCLAGLHREKSGSCSLLLMERVEHTPCLLLPHPQAQRCSPQCHRDFARDELGFFARRTHRLHPS